MVLINFQEPDHSGHAMDWKGYLEGLKKSDEYAFRIWEFLNTNENYKGTTTVFITNDHGRHLPGHKDGFISHGDECEGCKHINLFASGPDFKKGIITNAKRGQIDIPATIIELLHLNLPTAKGNLLEELFENR